MPDYVDPLKENSWAEIIRRQGVIDNPTSSHIFAIMAVAEELAKLRETLREIKDALSSIDIEIANK